MKWRWSFKNYTKWIQIQKKKWETSSGVKSLWFRVLGHKYKCKYIKYFENPMILYGLYLIHGCGHEVEPC